MRAQVPATTSTGATPCEDLQMNWPALDQLSPFVAKTKDVNAIVDTPKGSQNKFKFDEQSGLFQLAGAMPAGVVFPFEFGFIPKTRGGDGDALDLLILMDAPTFVGCLVQVRLVGVIEAKQTEVDGRTEQNDRLIGVAVKSRRHEHVRALSELPKQLVTEIEHFFVSYNAIKGKRFAPEGRFGAKRAVEIVQAGVAFAKSQSS